MNALKLQRKYPQLGQEGVLALVNQFNQIDLDGTGRLPQRAVIDALSKSSPDYSYDDVRETLKHVNLDASGNVELDDFVDLVARLRDSSAGGSSTPAGPQRVQRGAALPGLVAGGGATPVKATPTGSAGQTPEKGGRVLVRGSNANVSHTINDDERSEFTRHINTVRIYSN